MKSKIRPHDNYLKQEQLGRIDMLSRLLFFRHNHPQSPLRQTTVTTQWRQIHGNFLEETKKTIPNLGTLIHLQTALEKATIGNFPEAYKNTPHTLNVTTNMIRNLSRKIDTRITQLIGPCLETYIQQYKDAPTQTAPTELSRSIQALILVRYDDFKQELQKQTKDTALSEQVETHIKDSLLKNQFPKNIPTEINRLIASLAFQPFTHTTT